MRSRTLILLGIVFMACLCTVGIGAAAERQVTNESVDQWYSALNGGRVLWSDDRAGDDNIYLYNATEDAETAITNDSANQIVSAMSMRSLIENDRLVWQDNRSGNRDIFMYDLADGEEIQITDDAADQINPAIAGDWIVWQDNRSGNWDIFMYDLAGGREVQITTNASQQVTPGVTGSLIAWNDDRFGNWDIFIWVPDGAPAGGTEGQASPTVSVTPVATSGTDSNDGDAGTPDGNGGAPGSDDNATGGDNDSIPEGAVKPVEPILPPSGIAPNTDLPENVPWRSLNDGTDGTGIPGGAVQPVDPIIPPTGGSS